MKKFVDANYYFFALDKNWCFTFVNAKAAKILGRSPATLIGKDIWSEFPEYLSDNLRHAYEKALAEQEFVLIEEYYPPFGSWFENHIFPSPNGLSVYGIDITEKKDSQKKLERSQAILMATVNNTEIMIWSVDRDLRLTTYNTPFSEFLGRMYGRFPRHGVNIIEQLLHEDNIPQLAYWNESLLKVLNGQADRLDNIRFGPEHVCSFNPITDGERVIGVTIFAYDLTEQKAREKQLAEANKKIEDLKMMALRSVMNPHFIFSTLNSIQYYIMENDRPNAIHYLTAFSKLIRGILNNSVAHTVSLSEELNILNLYVKLERMRLENKFDFTLEIDDSIDPDTIEIPSMLIQPFVENAIVHGLSNKAERGTLRISIYKAGNTILFEIDDDGIGREAAMNFRNQNVKEHKSLSIALTEERLKLINAMDTASFEVIDKEENGRATGTLVKIQLTSME